MLNNRIWKILQMLLILSFLVWPIVGSNAASNVTTKSEGTKEVTKTVEDVETILEKAVDTAVGTKEADSVKEPDPGGWKTTENATESDIKTVQEVENILEKAVNTAVDTKEDDSVKEPDPGGWKTTENATESDIKTVQAVETILEKAVNTSVDTQKAEPQIFPSIESGEKQTEFQKKSIDGKSTEILQKYLSENFKNTDLDSDNIDDFYQIEHNIPLFDPDPDSDGYDTIDEIFLGLDPMVADTVPKQTHITNLNGMTVGGVPSIRLSGKAGEEVNVYLISANDPVQKRIYIGQTTIDENNKGEITVGHALADGEYLIMAEGAENIGNLSSFKVDSTVNLKISRIWVRDLGISVKNTLGILNKIVPQYGIKKLIENLESEAEKNTVVGYTKPGSTVFVTFKSLIFSSVVIADASQGRFEIEMPQDLPVGEHEIITYVFDEIRKMLSNVKRVLVNKIK